MIEEGGTAKEEKLSWICACAGCQSSEEQRGDLDKGRHKCFEFVGFFVQQVLEGIRRGDFGEDCLGGHEEFCSMAKA